jgi:PAS domain S-box-containing protein
VQMKSTFFNSFAIQNLSLVITESFILSLIQNVAILLVVGIIYDYFLKIKKSGRLIIKILTGLLVGFIGTVLVLTPCILSPGVVINFSSILLLVSGLFFGPVSTTIALISVCAGTLIFKNAVIGVEMTCIISSGITGILWHHFKPLWQNKKEIFQLTGLGIFLPLILLGSTTFFSEGLHTNKLLSFFIPILLLFPLVSISVGKYMIYLYNSRVNNDSNNLSKEQWLFALEGSGEGVWEWNRQTNDVLYSKQWKLMLGYKENELQNSYKVWDKLLHPDDREFVYSTMNNYLKGGILNYEIEYRLLCKNGTYKWIFSHGKVISRDENGKPIRFIGTHKDISDRKEKELLLTHERYLVDSLLKYTSESIYFKDLESRFIRVNDFTARNMDCECAQLIGKTDFDFYTKEFAEITYQQEQEIVRTGIPLSIEEIGRRKDGKVIWSLTNKMPLRDVNNNIIGTFGISIDITKIKEKELLLEQEQNFINSLLKHTTESIYFKDLDSKFIRVNEQSALNFGCEKATDLIGKSDADFFTAEFSDNTLKQEQHIIKTGEPLSIIEKGVLKNGKEVWGLTNRMPYRNFKGDIIGTFGISIDITEMKEKELMLDHERYLVDSLLKNTPESIFFKDLNGLFIRVNDETVKNIGCNDISQVIGKSDFDFYSNEFATSTLLMEREVIRTGKPVNVEERGIRKDGLVVWGWTNKMPLRDKNGNIIGIFGISIDITKRKHAEEALKESQNELKNFAAHLQIVREEERVLLAREIHDELGQILIALKIDMGMLKRNVLIHTQNEFKENTQVEFVKVFDVLDKTIKTTRKIMTGLRSEVLELVGVLEAMNMYSIEYSERYHIHSKFRTGESDINIDSQKSIALYRIFQEALTNVAKHARATEVIIDFNIVDNKIILKIEDNGIGINKKVKVKTDSYGMIGMKERVYLLDGKISITGQPGKGTTVLVEMPYKTI